MTSTDNLNIFKAGKIYNPIKGKINKTILIYKSIEVTVPARLNTMCFDLKTLTKPKKKFIYNAGELAFSVNLDTYAKITINKNSSEVLITANTKRKSIVKHATLIMMNALKISEGLIIEANNTYDYPHSGLGSSSSLITAVCVAINEMFGAPLNKRQLSLFISQNHGEEINFDDENLIHVQCNGGSPSVAIYEGGMQIITGESEMIFRKDIPNKYTFVFGMPVFYKKVDAKALMCIETKQFGDMLQSSNDHSKEIAWKVLHELIPAMSNGNMFNIGKIIEYYRFETSSLMIDSVTWNGLYELMKELIQIRSKDTPIISVYSCGPAIYVLTTDPDKVIKILEDKGMKTFISSPNNNGYNILNTTK